MSGQPLPPSARDPAAGETNPRREEVRGLGLRGGPWRYVSLAVGIVLSQERDLTLGQGTDRAEIRTAAGGAPTGAICGGDRAGFFESSPVTSG